MLSGLLTYNYITLPVLGTRRCKCSHIPLAVIFYLTESRGKQPGLLGAHNYMAGSNVGQTKTRSTLYSCKTVKYFMAINPQNFMRSNLWAFSFRKTHPIMYQTAITPMTCTEPVRDAVIETLLII